MSNEIVKKYQEINQGTTTSRKDQKDVISSSGGIEQSQSQSQKKKWIQIGLPILIVIILGIVILVYFFFIKDLTNGDKNSGQNNSTDVPRGEDPFEVIIPEYREDNEKLESEFEFKTLVGDLQRIQLIQRYVEDRLFEGQRIKRK